MENKSERVLLATALVICALLIGYNLFYSSELREPVIIITQETLGEEENSPEVSDLIDINHANKEELCQLTGIGEVLAQRIIDYRTEYGSFAQPEDLKNVKGIGEKVFERLKEEITLS